MTVFVLFELFINWLIFNFCSILNHSFIICKGLATLEAFTCFYFLTKLSSNVFLMGNQKQRAVGLL